jgi:thiol-disulfide isomerase/thioredoxin
MKRSLGASEWIRRGLGVALLCGVAAIALGLDTGVLARLSTANTSKVEQSLLDKVAPVGSQAQAQAPAAAAAGALPVEGPFPSLAGAVSWLNSPPLTTEGLRGKVVLVDFWTYSCINCPRAIPYVRAWAADLRSNETYVGYERAENFASTGGFVRDQPHVYSAPASLDLNQWGLVGNWTVGDQAASVNQRSARIAFRFHARDLHLVLGPGADGKPVRFRILIDGQPAGANHGVDVNEQGAGRIDAEHLYQLVRQKPPIGDHLFEIEFLDPGARAFAFTFG